jgi:DNA (cytosine-5)-methyltransferase 1
MHVRMSLSVSHIGKKWAYYNDVDPFCCEWVRNLIKAGHVAPGVVDERPIEAVQPEDLREFCQVHMFCGIAVWSHALRSAGWPDTRPVWTGSCPCQPFSCAGKQLGTADKRHLWPAWFRLIRECRPEQLFGEQVAGPAALEWFDLVSADLEDAGYAVGATDLCAASCGGPHIRQRLYWMANRCGEGLAGRAEQPAREERATTERSGNVGGLAYADQGERGRLTDGEGCESNGEASGREQGDGELESHSAACGVADSTPGGQRIDGGAPGNTRHAPQRESAGGLADADGGQPSDGGVQRSGRFVQLAQDPLAGFWAGADWIQCTDGKARPIKPGSAVLASGVAGRLGKLRALGNSLCAPVAIEFVRAAMKCLPG